MVGSHCAKSFACKISSNPHNSMIWVLLSSHTNEKIEAQKGISIFAKLKKGRIDLSLFLIFE